jgi:uncharacterized integral membrane protein
MTHLRLLIGVILLILVAIFTLQNTEVVSINFLIWRFSMSRVLMIFMLLAAGILIGWLLHSLTRHGKKH